MNRNIYQEARRFAGKTQNEAAEALYIGKRTLQGYEEGRIHPSSDMVDRMTTLYNCPWLGYRHLQETSVLGQKLLPQIMPMGLCQAVVSMQKELGDVQRQITKLLEIASDGMVDVSEADQFNVICREAEEAAGTLLTLALCGRTIDGGAYANTAHNQY